MIEMIKNKGPLFLYGVSGLITIYFYLIMSVFLSEKSFIYNFLFRAWVIQSLNSWLFLIGVFYWIQRYLFFKMEEEAFQKIKLPEFLISREKAEELIETMPDKYKQTITLRRFREILQAFIYSEDIIRLNEELSRRDMDEVERGHLALNSLRNIIPIIGFLGTVIGLSLGMTKFPEVTDPAVLKTALKGFAASLSVAFDTTLLALGYTIVVILLTSFLRQREEALVSKVDERARILVKKVKVEITPHNSQPQKGIEQLTQIAKEVEVAVKRVGEVFSQKLEEIKEGINRPPRYQIIVQPLQEN